MGTHNNNNRTTTTLNNNESTTTHSRTHIAQAATLAARRRSVLVYRHRQGFFYKHKHKVRPQPEERQVNELGDISDAWLSCGLYVASRRLPCRHCSLGPSLRNISLLTRQCWKSERIELNDKSPPRSVVSSSDSRFGAFSEALRIAMARRFREGASALLRATSKAFLTWNRLACAHMKSCAHCHWDC